MMVIERYMKMLGYDEFYLEFEKYLKVPSLLRLKNICYFCGMDYASKDIYNFKEHVSRYDHSLNVALITWMLTRDRRATLAGLFHDISTPCFSHVIDYMNNDYESQESTEEKTEEIIKNDIYLLELLLEDNILVEEIIDFKKYSIVDMKRPMLCADRLDGIILTGFNWTKNLDFDDIDNIINSLIMVKNEFGNYEIGLKDQNVAKLIVDTNKIIDIYCHSKEDNFMMELLAKITKRVIDLKIINYDDLFIMNEIELFNILDKCDDIYLLDDLHLFRNITDEMITDIDMPSSKVRLLNPIVKDRRLL